jgi:hypothetical protein
VAFWHCFRSFIQRRLGHVWLTLRQSVELRAEDVRRLVRVQLNVLQGLFAPCDLD